MNFRTYYIQVFEAVFFWFLCKLFSLWFLSGSLNLNLLTSWWRHQIEYFVLIWCQSVVLQFLKLASFCLLSTPYISLSCSYSHDVIVLLTHEYWFSMQISSCDIFCHGIFPSNLWPWQYFFAHFCWGRFQILRNLIPQNDQKRDKASFLLEVFQLVMFWFYNFILEISSYGSKLTLEVHIL